jgi:hypothetical protein
VRHDQPPAILRQVADAHRLGESADASDVGLGNGDLADVHQLAKFVSRVEPLAGSDAHRCVGGEVGVAFEVVAR